MKNKFIFRIWTFFLGLPLTATMVGYLLATMYEHHVSLDEWFWFSIVASFPIYTLWFLANYKFCKTDIDKEDFV